MKNFIAGALALTLLGATAASAAPYGHGGGHGSYGHGGYSRGYHGGYRHGGDGALIGLGVGLFALAAIAASSNHDDYAPGYAYGPPPPPPGYYNRGYDYDR